MLRFAVQRTQFNGVRAKLKVIPLNNQDTPSELNKEKEVFELDEETVKILGEEPPKSQKELDIHANLARRWNSWLQQGLKKEIRDELLMKHPRADTCSLEPPILNQKLSALNSNILKKIDISCLLKTWPARPCRH